MSRVVSIYQNLISNRILFRCNDIKYYSETQVNMLFVLPLAPFLKMFYLLTYKNYLDPAIL